MDKKDFLKLLHKNSDPSSQETEALSDTVKEYPFFQSARALQLKGLHRHQRFAYNAALKKTAAHTISRAVLFDYITSEDFKQHAISSAIQDREKPSTPIQKTDLGLDEKQAEQVLDPELFTEKETSKENKGETERKTAQPEENQPAEFDKSQSHTFSEWLKLTRSEPIQRKEETTEEPEEKEGRHTKIIDEFIAKNPKIAPPSPEESRSQIPRSKENQDLMTETLAQVYVDQKNYNRAIQAYKILKLKNPEKSGLFANRIQVIQEMKENK